MDNENPIILTNACELSDAVARHVMGWTWSDANGWWYKVPEGWELPKDTLGIPYMPGPDYDDWPLIVKGFDITCSIYWMMVVEALRKDEMKVWLAFDDIPVVNCELVIDYDLTAVGKAHHGEPGVAIGLAALKMRGIDYTWAGE